MAVFLGIEFLDELVDGALSAAWPLLRSELALSYTQIGLLVGLPRMVGNLAELFMGVLADIGWRRALIRGGGAGCFVALTLVGSAPGAGQRMAGLAVAGLTGAHLAGAALLLPLLGRLTGSAYLRASAVGVLVTLPAFLLTPHPEAELALVVLLGLFTSGWYPVLKAKLYEALPGQSGTAMTLGTVSGLLGGLLPVALGRFAEAYGLGATLWWLLAGPVALLAGVPLRGRAGRAGGDAEPDGGVEPVGKSGGGHGDDHDGDRREGWKRKG